MQQDITRARFGAAFAGGVFALWGVVLAAEAALPWMAEVLSPRGVNAAFVLNGIWLAAGAVFAAVTMWLIAERMRDIGRTPWWAPAAVLPLGLLALLNDAIFLVSRTFALPPLLNRILIVVALIVVVWVLAECLLRPSRRV